MFEWYKKKRLAEQIKFFGGTQKKFVSCYAKQVKPRIRMNNKPKPSINTRYGVGAAQALFAQQQALGGQLANLQAQNGALLSNLQAQNGALLSNQMFGLGGAGQAAGFGGLAGIGQTIGSMGARGY